jgi:hypothetical protein
MVQSCGSFLAFVDGRFRRELPLAQRSDSWPELPDTIEKLLDWSDTQTLSVPSELALV